MNGPRLVIFGDSNILSDLFDCALALGLEISCIVLHHPSTVGPRDKPLQQRLQALARLAPPPRVEHIGQFAPGDNEIYMLGPTTPSRAELADLVAQRWALPYTRLIHPTAYISPLASLGQGVFVGANSVVGPGADLGQHVFVNRGVTIGHDTAIGAFSRVQPGSNLGGLSRLGRGVTVAIGATLLERLVVGDGAFIGAGAVVIDDVEPRALMLGVPARCKKMLAGD